MKRFISIAVFIFICSSGIAQVKKAPRENTTKTDSIKKEQEDLIFKKIALFPNNTQLSIALIDNGIPSFYGLKRQSDSAFVLNNHNKVFEIGSITKIFTSTLLADFVIANKLNLQDIISAHMTFSLGNDKDITFMQLSNHTSGLPRLPTNLELDSENFNNPYSEYSEKKLQEYAGELELNFPPGEEYHYSNLGAGLLGFLLTKRSNRSYEDLLQSLISSRYQMKNTTTNLENIRDSLVTGLDKEGNEASNWNFSSLVGAGGILSTVKDLSKFVIAQFNNCDKVLNLTRLPTFNINENLSIGLGWHIIEEGDVRLFSHNGGTGGYSSSIIVDPVNQNAVIILSNVSAFNEKAKNIVDLAFNFMDTLKTKTNKLTRRLSSKSEFN